jgi:microcystin-dependent protein
VCNKINKRLIKNKIYNMSCTNCFNGCSEITSDKCVKYTGADIPTLGIQNGDTLQFVEQTLAEFLINALNGSGIKPNIDPTIICNAVSVNLPTCGEFTIVDLISGLIKSVCDLQEEIDLIIVDVEEINAALAILNAPYTVPPCIDGEVDNTSTHDVLQALLDNFCALVISLPETYVALNGPGGIQDIITQALEDEGLIGNGSTKQYTKMIPYVAYPWFAPLSYVTGKFDINGAGITGLEFENVYFCNGNFPNVPDLRGRVLAGATTGMAGGPFNAAVDPNTVGNPNYLVNPSFTTTGVNFVTLQKSEMPQHFHTNTAVSIAVAHDHDSMLFSPSLRAISSLGTGINASGRGVNSNDPSSQKTIKTSEEVVDVNTTVTIDPEGQNQAHTNTQPTIGCYYIMYIPV